MHTRQVNDIILYHLNPRINGIFADKDPPVENARKLSYNTFALPRSRSGTLRKCPVNSQKGEKRE